MSVVLTLRYHDSEPGGGICKDDADAKAEAAKVAREVLNDLADPDELHMAFDKVACDREADDGPADAPIPTDVAELTDDEALDIAADLMEFEWDTLPGAPDLDPASEIALLRRLADTVGPVLAEHGREDDYTEAMGAAFDAYQDAPGDAKPEPTGPTPVVVIAAGVRCALAVIEAWESGDLAATVRELAEWTRDARKDFPDLDLEGAPGTTEDEISLCVLDIKPGDRVDLKGVYAEDSTDANAAEFEYGLVIGGERETDDCMRLDFENFPSFGFEAWRDLPVIKGTAADRLFYAEGEE